MTLLRPFTLHEPESVDSVLPLLSRYGDNGRILAGGTELLLAMKQGILGYDHLINIKHIPGLDEIDYDDKKGQLAVGPLVTHRALETSDLIKRKFPLIADMERHVANIRIRNAGTVGGNLCWADPHSDVATLLLAYRSRVKVVGSDGERVIELDDFLIDYYETALKEDEMLTEIHIPDSPPESCGAYLRFKLAERPTVGVAVILTFGPGDETITDANITLGCVNPTPMRAREAEEITRGKGIDEVLATVDSIGAVAAKESSPTDDIHASEWYKREMIRVMVKRTIQEAYRRRTGQKKAAE